jgi:hypothetical protein
MNLAAALFLSLAQAGDPLLPVTVSCLVDTELPLAEIRATVREKRELSVSPSPSGKLTLRDLPEGELHLLFYRNETPLGEVTLGGARLGQFIQIKVRLVEGNAILLEELRVKGVSGEEATGSVTPLPVPAPASPAPVSPTPLPLPSTPAPLNAPSGLEAKPSSRCPSPEQPVDEEGVVLRVIDNDSFELETRAHRRLTAYAGSAARLRPSGAPVNVRSLKPGQRLRLVGAGAAGPEGECSVGVREIWLR